MSTELKPHQERVLDEHKDLSDKSTRLENFIANPDGPFPALPEIEQILLKQQLDVMKVYKAILSYRISRFS